MPLRSASRWSVTLAHAVTGRRGRDPGPLGKGMWLITTFLTVAPSGCANKVACRTFRQVLVFRESDSSVCCDRFPLLTVQEDEHSEHCGAVCLPQGLRLVFSRPFQSRNLSVGCLVWLMCVCVVIAHTNS